MRNIFAVFLCLMVASCNYFNVKKTSTEAILQEELTAFNWNEVDEYPTFSSCDSLPEKKAQKMCFENTLTEHVLQFLSQQELIVSCDLNDTIFIDFKLSEKGKMSIDTIIANKKILEGIPELNNYIYSSIDSLPQIFPAIKRGQQVKTQFRLPILIKSD